MKLIPSTSITVVGLRGTSVSSVCTIILNHARALQHGFQVLFGNQIGLGIVPSNSLDTSPLCGGQQGIKEGMGLQWWAISLEDAPRHMKFGVLMQLVGLSFHWWRAWGTGAAPQALPNPIIHLHPSPFHLLSCYFFISFSSFSIHSKPFFTILLLVGIR